jgi:hypothetical protein
MSLLHRDGTHAAWHGGALTLDHDGQVMLIDAPEGVVHGLPDALLARLGVIVVSSGILRDHAGLLPLLEARARHGTGPITVVFPLGEERVSAVVEAWQRGWPDRLDLFQDAVHPGAVLELDAFTLRAVAVGRGEPRWFPTPRVEPVIALGWQVQCGGLRIALVRGAIPDASIEHVVRGADLAIVEFGIRPWPRSDQRWRLRPDEAARVATGAVEVWLVGDDGQLIGGAAQ